MSTTLTPVTITPTTPPIMATKDTDGEVWVPLKPACEAMGINSNKQAERLNRQEWAVTTLMVSTGSDGKSYKMLMMDRQTVTMWLATLDASRVSPESRALIVAYQKQAAKALDNYFHEGGAINPNATADQLDRLSREVQRRRESARWKSKPFLQTKVYRRVLAQSTPHLLAARSRSCTSRQQVICPPPRRRS